MFQEARRPRRALLALVLVLAAACGRGAATQATDGAPRARTGARATLGVDVAREAERFDAERAWRDLATIVGFGPRPAGSTRLERLRAWLESELDAAGVAHAREEFTAPTPIGSLGFVNLVATLPADDAAGADPPIVVVAAHVDTKRLDFPFVGANDGGSGTAALLEIARALAARPPGPLEWRLVFLDGEESVRHEWADPDNRYGSRHHVARLRESGLLPRVAACVLLDLVADRDLRFTAERNSDPELLALFFAAARSLGLERHVGARPQEISDDHLSFQAAGIPSVDLIDFEYGPGNAWWHAPEDTLERCSRESLGAAGRIVLAGLAALEAAVARGELAGPGD